MKIKTKIEIYPQYYDNNKKIIPIESWIALKDVILLLKSPASKKQLIFDIIKRLNDGNE